MIFFNNYRIDSARLPERDYGAGWYFITVCTRGRTPWLSTMTGEDVIIRDAAMLARTRRYIADNPRRWVQRQPFR